MCCDGVIMMEEYLLFKKMHVTTQDFGTGGPPQGSYGYSLNIINYAYFESNQNAKI